MLFNVLGVNPGSSHEKPGTKSHRLQDCAYDTVFLLQATKKNKDHNREGVKVWDVYGG